MKKLLFIAILFFPLIVSAQTIPQLQQWLPSGNFLIPRSSTINVGTSTTVYYGSGSNLTGITATTTGNWLGTWQSRQPSDFLSSSTSYESPLTFTTSTDTNLGIQISRSLNTINFLPTWIGTLADGRISSASNWNSKATSTLTLTAGAGLTGGGTLEADRTFTVGAGTGITVNADDVALTIPVAVSIGGTGSTTAAGALTNLGAQATLVSGTNIKTINSNSLLGSGDLEISGGGGVATTTPFSAGYIPFATSSNSITNSNIFQLSGNVGIGTTSPAYKLDVVGTGRFTGALTLDTALTDANISSASTWNAKQNTLSFPLNYASTTHITATTPLVINSGVLSMPTSTASQNGFLLSTDWNTFNAKITTSSLSSTATGLTYTSNTGVFSWTAGYEGLKESSSTAWNAKQDALVSGTNIKTINSTSLLGSGDLAISASPGGSDTQIQFNNGGAFGGDANLTWSSSTKKFSLFGDNSGDGTTFQITNNWSSSTLRFISTGSLILTPTTATSSNIGIEDSLMYSNRVGISLREGGNAPSLNFGTGSWLGEDLFLVRRNGDLTIETGTTPVEKIRITSSGSIGIGTSTPQYKLDIQGDLRVNTSSTLGNVISGVWNGTAIGDTWISSASNWNSKATSTLTLTAGSGLTGGGDLTANRTFTIGAGTNIVVNADDVAVTSTPAFTFLTLPSITNSFLATDANGLVIATSTPSGGSGVALGDSPSWTGQHDWKYAGVPVNFQNTTDAVSNQVAIFSAGNRVTPADNDQGYLSLFGDNDLGNQVEFSRILWEMDDVTNTTKDSTLRFYNQINNTLTDGMNLVGKDLTVNGSIYSGPGSFTISAGEGYLAGGRLAVSGGASGNDSYSYRGSSLTNQKMLLGNSDIIVSANYSAVAFGVAPRYSEASSGNHPLFTSIGIKPLIIDTGAATVSDTASLYIEGAATTTVVSGKNYSLWVDDVGGGGTSRIDGGLALNTNTATSTLTVNGNIQISSSTGKLIFPDATTQATAYKDMGFNVYNASTTQNGASSTIQKVIYQALTITQIDCSSDGASVTLVADERASSTPQTYGTAVFNGTGLVCSSTGNSTSTFSNAGMAANAVLNFGITNVANATTTLRVNIKYKND